MREWPGDGGTIRDRFDRAGERIVTVWTIKGQAVVF
jgi:hypothetical protein